MSQVVSPHQSSKVSSTPTTYQMNSSRAHSREGHTSIESISRRSRSSSTSKTQVSQMIKKLNQSQFTSSTSSAMFKVIAPTHRMSFQRAEIQTTFGSTLSTNETFDFINNSERKSRIVSTPNKLISSTRRSDISTQDATVTHSSSNSSNQGLVKIDEWNSQEEQEQPQISPAKKAPIFIIKANKQPDNQKKPVSPFKTYAQSKSEALGTMASVSSSITSDKKQQNKMVIIRNSKTKVTESENKVEESVAEKLKRDESSIYHSKDQQGSDLDQSSKISYCNTSNICMCQQKDEQIAVLIKQNQEKDELIRQLQESLYLATSSLDRNSNQQEQQQKQLTLEEEKFEQPLLQIENN